MEFLQNFFDRNTVVLAVVGGFGIICFMISLRLMRRERTLYSQRQQDMAKRIEHSEKQSHEYAKKISRNERLHILSVALQDMLELKYPSLQVRIEEGAHFLMLHLPKKILYIEYAPYTHSMGAGNTLWHVQEILPDGQKSAHITHLQNLPALEQYVLGIFQGLAEEDTT